MLQNLLFSVNTSLPLFILLGLGYVLTRKGMFSDDYVSRTTNLVYYVMLPAKLFLDCARPTCPAAFDPKYVAVTAGRRHGAVRPGLGVRRPAVPGQDQAERLCPRLLPGQFRLPGHGAAAKYLRQFHRLHGGDSGHRAAPVQHPGRGPADRQGGRGRRPCGQDSAGRAEKSHVLAILADCPLPISMWSCPLW